MTDLGGIPNLLKQSLGALVDPAANPLAALFSLAVIVLALLILLLVAYLVVVSVGDRRAPRDAASPVMTQRELSPRQRSRRLFLRVGTGLVLLAAAAYGWTYSSGDVACGRCHYTQRAIDSHEGGAHAEVSCRACHVGPGASAAVFARISGAENLLSQMTGRPDDGIRSAEVANGACIECHADVLEGVLVARSIRIRHSDLLALAYACTDCHNTEGHGQQVRRALYPRMMQCLPCHDGKTAPSGCPACHSEDVGVAVRRLQRPFAQTNVDREDCRGCHSMEPCIACHGLELPHSREFKDGYHARKGLYETKVCVKCHDIKAFCNICHRFDAEGRGATTWKRTHANMGDFVTWHSTADPERAGSCRCHTDNRQQFCDYCHGPQPER
jgi:hypothetical protein